MNEVEIKLNNEEEQDTEKTQAVTAVEMETTATASVATTVTTTTLATTSTEISSSLSNMVTQEVPLSQSYPLCPTLKYSYCVLDMEPGTMIVGTASISETNAKVFFTFRSLSCVYINLNLAISLLNEAKHWFLWGVNLS